MSLNFSSLKSEADLKQIDSYLAFRVYVFNLESTVQYVTLFGLIGIVPKSVFPNVTRYFNHIQTFNGEAQAKKFPAIERLYVRDTPAVAAAAPTAGKASL